MGSYVALSELKSALGITVSTDDAFLNLAIDSAEQSIDDLCGRKFSADGSASARTYRAQPYICVTDDISTLTGLVVKTDTSGDGKLQEDEFVQHNLETAKALSDFDFAQQLRMWTTLARLRA